jgi:hypothetical protein
MNYLIFNKNKIHLNDRVIIIINVIDTISGDIGDTLVRTTKVSTLIGRSMMNSTLVGINRLNPSTTPLVEQVTYKEHCQVKKSNNRFNALLGTKFYRVHVKSWKPTISSLSIY